MKKYLRLGLVEVDFKPTIAKCMTCRKRPRNCRCFTYRITPGSGGQFAVLVDNVATEPVRGEEVGVWQPRRNAKMWIRPQFVDGIHVLYFREENLNEIKEAIENETFFVEDYAGREGIRIPSFDRNYKQRLPFFRRARKRKSNN